jgi:hypothetical protein
MPSDTFGDIDDVGMWVSRRAVRPRGMDRLTDMTAEIAVESVELRGLPAFHR